MEQQERRRVSRMGKRVHHLIVTWGDHVSKPEQESQARQMRKKMKSVQTFEADVVAYVQENTGSNPGEGRCPVRIVERDTGRVVWPVPDM